MKCYAINDAAWQRLFADMAEKIENKFWHDYYNRFDIAPESTQIDRDELSTAMEGIG